MNRNDKILLAVTALVIFVFVVSFLNTVDSSGWIRTLLLVALGFVGGVAFDRLIRK